MCFHTSQTKKVTAIEKRFDVNLLEADAREAFDEPSFHLNGFAHPEMLIIPQEGADVLADAYWGIVPENTNPENLSDYYKKAVRFGGGLNARSEKLFDHFLYKKSAFHKRCLIPVTGFFEPHEQKKKKYPYYIHRQDKKLFALAGIYSRVGDLVTFSILTKEASPLFEKIHNQKKRQPVVLHEQLEKEWLAENLNEKNIQDLLHTNYNDNEIEAYPVSKSLFSPKVNSNHEDILQKETYPELTPISDAV